MAVVTVDSMTENEKETGESARLQITRTGVPLTGQSGTAPFTNELIVTDKSDLRGWREVKGMKNPRG